MCQELVKYMKEQLPEKYWGEMIANYRECGQQSRDGQLHER